MKLDLRAVQPIEEIREIINKRKATNEFFISAINVSMPIQKIHNRILIVRVRDGANAPYIIAKAQMRNFCSIRIPSNSEQKFAFAETL